MVVLDSSFFEAAEGNSTNGIAMEPKDAIPVPQKPKVCTVQQLGFGFSDSDEEVAVEAVQEEKKDEVKSKIDTPKRLI